MKYVIFLIPVVIGIFSGMFLSYYGPNFTEKNPASLTESKLILNGSPFLGNPSAKITILEFGDYQCTYCYRFHQSTLENLKTNYIDSGKVRLVFKDFPLNGPDSVLAAEAAYCAGEQEKYWPYHNELYKNWAGEKTGWITRESLDKFGITVGLDLDKFNQCINGHKYKEMIEMSYRFGQDIGIDGTPSFLIFNNEKIIKIVGNQPLDVFIRAIDEL